MTDKMQTWQEQQDRTQALGQDTINRVITDLRKLADGLEHYRDAYNRAMWQNNYSAAKDHLEATQRVLTEMVNDNTSRIEQAAGEVETTNHLRHEVQIESIKEKQA